MLSESEKRIVKNNETALLQKTRNNRSRNVTKLNITENVGQGPPQKCYKNVTKCYRKCYKNVTKENGRPNRDL